MNEYEVLFIFTILISNFKEIFYYKVLFKFLLIFPAYHTFKLPYRLTGYCAKIINSLKTKLALRQELLAEAQIGCQLHTRATHYSPLLSLYPTPPNSPSPRCRCMCRRINVAGKKFVVGRQKKNEQNRKEKLREKIEILFCDLWQCVAEPGDLL